MPVSTFAEGLLLFEAFVLGCVPALADS